jgi:hypothetical protein
MSIKRPNIIMLPSVEGAFPSTNSSPSADPHPHTMLLNGTSYPLSTYNPVRTHVTVLPTGLLNMTCRGEPERLAGYTNETNTTLPGPLPKVLLAARVSVGTLGFITIFLGLYSVRYETVKETGRTNI